MERRAFRLALRRRALWERDVDDEIGLHLALRIEQLVARGWTPEAARAEAERRFGELAAARPRLMEAARRREEQMRWTEWLETVRQDATYALRQLARAPGFTAAAIITLALGIGANTTMFGVVDRLLLKPPAHVADPARVASIAVESRGPTGALRTQEVLSYPLYRDVVASGAFQHVAAWSRTTLTLGAGATAQRVRGMLVSAGYFATFGARPRLGRFFLPEEDGDPVAPPVVVVSHGFWQRQLAGDPAVVGKALPLGGTRYTVVGVAPEGFTGLGLGAVDAWIPLTAGITPEEHASWARSRQAYWLFVAARPNAGVSFEQAAAAATRAIHAGARQSGWSETQLRDRAPRAALTSALPRHARRDRPESKVAVLLGAVSLLVLLLACANVANLQLARGLRRRREIAIRVALGVSRGRLLRQLVLESVLLALVGGAAAILVARWGSVFVQRVLLANVDAVASVDARVLAYTALAALATGVLTGLLPALQSSRPEIAGTLREGAREGRVHRSRTRGVLLLGQAALTIVLLVGTGLFVRSLGRVESLPTGMEPGRVLVADIEFSGQQTDRASRLALYQRLDEVARATPGVESVALAISVPFSSSWAEQVSVPGKDSLPVTGEGGPYFNAVSADFFRTVGMRVLRGRGFTPADQRASQRVVVVNETLARMWWPTEEAIGRCMKIGGDTMPCAEIVGVVANARRQALIEDESVQYFVPIEQAPAWVDNRVLFIRPSGDAEQAVERLRRRLQGATPQFPFVDVRPLASFVSPQTQSWRLGATMFGAFGVLALVLAAVGLYGVLAFDVAQRTRELGVRVALGASRRNIARLIVGDGMRIALVGGVVGVAIALAAGRYVKPLLFRTDPREPGVYLLALLVLGGVTLLATLLPARRAVRVDPIVAMKAE